MLTWDSWHLQNFISSSRMVMEVAEFGEMFGGSVNVLGNYLGGGRGGERRGGTVSLTFINLAYWIWSLRELYWYFPAGAWPSTAQAKAALNRDIFGCLENLEAKWWRVWELSGFRAQYLCVNHRYMNHSFGSASLNSTEMIWFLKHFFFSGAKLKWLHSSSEGSKRLANSSLKLDKAQSCIKSLSLFFLYSIYFWLFPQDTLFPRILSLFL